MGISPTSICSAFSSTNWQIKLISARENVIIARLADLLTATTTFCTLKSSRVPSFFMTLISLHLMVLFLLVFCRSIQQPAWACLQIQLLLYL